MPRRRAGEPGRAAPACCPVPRGGYRSSRGRLLVVPATTGFVILGRAALLTAAEAATLLAATTLLAASETALLAATLLAASETATLAAATLLAAAETAALLLAAALLTAAETATLPAAAGLLVLTILTLVAVLLSLGHALCLSLGAEGSLRGHLRR